MNDKQIVIILPTYIDFKNDNIKALKQRLLVLVANINPGKISDCLLKLIPMFASLIDQETQK